MEEKEKVTVKVIPDGEQEKKMTMLYFKREGYLIPLWCIVTIEKGEKWLELSRCNVFTIVINKNMVQSERIKVGEKEFVYNTEEVRDKTFDAIVELLCEHNDVTAL